MPVITYMAWGGEFDWVDRVGRRSIGLRGGGRVRRVGEGGRIITKDGKR